MKPQRYVEGFVIGAVWALLFVALGALFSSGTIRVFAWLLGR